MTTPSITADMAGTWLDGWHGWTNNYRVVDRAVEYGFVVPAEYVDDLEAYRDGAESPTEDITGQGGLSDMATAYLDGLAPRGFEFHWDMGELSLVASWQVCQNGCTETVRCFDHKESEDGDDE